MRDVLANWPETLFVKKPLEIKCLDKGFVRLVDSMPRIIPDNQTSADYAIAQSARVSYGDGTKTVNEDEGLIRYLMRHKHTTPFEMIEFKFHIKAPIFVARQWLRHRTANVNEYSGRYSVMKDEFYIPSLDNIRKQSKSNKQGSEGALEETDAQGFLNALNEMCEKSYQTYFDYNEKGVAREQSRMILPVNNYTEWYWKIDLHNLFHFLALRSDSHAQWEIRVFSDAMIDLITPIVPISVQAWNDYHENRGAVKLTRLEIEALRNMLQESNFNVPLLDTQNKREQAEWVEKAKKLGLGE